MGGAQPFRGDPRERATRIELALSAWEADVMPFHYARVWLYWVSIERDGKVANHVAK